MCAAKGTLPGQNNRNIRFAYAPKFLEPNSGDKPIGNCGGYSPEGCGDEGYASSDIFYMEACVYSMMCSNRDQFWKLDAEEDFQCEMSWEVRALHATATLLLHSSLSRRARCETAAAAAQPFRVARSLTMRGPHCASWQGYQQLRDYLL